MTTKLIGEDTRARLRGGETWSDDCVRLLAVIERGEELLAAAEAERDALRAAVRECLPECDRCGEGLAAQVSMQLNEEWCDGCVGACGSRGGVWRDTVRATAARLATGGGR